MKKFQEIGYKDRDVVYEDFEEIAYEIETDVRFWGYRILRAELIPLSTASPIVKNFISKANFWKDPDVKDDRQIGYMEIVNKLGGHLNLYFASRDWLDVGERLSPAGQEYLTFIITDKAKRKILASKERGKFNDIVNALAIYKLLPESKSLEVYKPFFENEDEDSYSISEDFKKLCLVVNNFAPSLVRYVEDPKGKGYYEPNMHRIGPGGFMSPKVGFYSIKIQAYPVEMEVRDGQCYFEFARGLEGVRFMFRSPKGDAEIADWDFKIKRFRGGRGGKWFGMIASIWDGSEIGMVIHFK
jgi:hypothetical protein